ncbi:MAG: fatty acyl-AMP ligase [Maricaulaceae bacterium]
MQPTPTLCSLQPFCPGGFASLKEALDYVAQGERGLNFHTARGELADVLSYRELAERARTHAGRFVRLGLVPGDRVILLADTDRDFVINFMACQYAGLLPAPAPIPVLFGEQSEYIEGLRRRIVDAKAQAAIGPAALEPLLREAAEGLRLKFLGSAEAFAELPADPCPEIAVQGDDIAYLQYSSGSTRSPAGIEISQNALMANTSGIMRSGLVGRNNDRAASWLPPYHDMGLVGFLLTPLCAGLSVDFVKTRDFARRPLIWLKILSQNRATLAYSPTFGYELCVRQAARAKPTGLDLSSWRAAGIGGDMVRARVLDDFAETFAPFGFRREAFVPSYGLAETTLAVSFAQLDRGPSLHAVSRQALDAGRVEFAAANAPDASVRTFVGCGRVLPEHTLSFRDSEGREVAPGRVGRVFVKGPSVMSGYFDKPLETARVLDAEGWLDTGDLGFMDQDELVITGRAKDLILLKGRNIWPQDLEWEVEALPQLRRGDAAAFGVDDGERETVVVLVQARLSDPAARAGLVHDVAACLKRQGLSEASVVLVPPGALPQTPSGKLSRARAKMDYLAGVYADTGPEPRAAAL